MATYSKTRWWSHWEVLYQIMVQFGDVEHFLTNVDVGAAATHSQLLNIVQDAHKSQVLHLELAAVINAGQYFVKATYQLEGDGLILQAYEEIAKVRAVIQSAHYPKVAAFAQWIAKVDANLQQH